MELPEALQAFLARSIPRLHVRIWRLSRARFATHMRGVEFCLLTTTGRKSGRARTTPLVLIRHEGKLLIVASSGGSANDPSWYANLTENPRVTVEMRDGPLSLIARVADDDERMVLWPVVTRSYAGYRAYQDKTARTIPIVILEPTEKEAPRT